MIDRTLVTSGFDTETLVSERYIRYLIMAQIEAGLLTLQSEEIIGPGLIRRTLLHPPAADYQRLYEAHSSAPLPEPMPQSFNVELMPGNNQPIEAVAVTPDGLTLASAAWDSDVRLWDAEKGAMLAAMPGHSGDVTSVAFSPDGARLASGSFDRTVRIWNVAAQDLARSLAGHTGAVLGLAFHPDGIQLASASFDQSIRLWDSDQGVLLRAFIGHTGPVRAVAFSPDGLTLASAADDHTVRLWDAASGDQIDSFTGHSDRVRSIAYSPDGASLLSAGDDGTIRRWDAVTGVEQLLIDAGSPVARAAFRPDGIRIVSATDDSNVREWNLAGGALFREYNDHRGPVRDVTYTADGTTIVSCARDEDIHRWRVSDGVLRNRLTVPFMRLGVRVSVLEIDTTTNSTTFRADGNNMDIILNLQLRSTPSGGLTRDHRLQLTFAHLDPQTEAVLLLLLSPQEVADIVTNLRTKIDSELPLGVAQGQRVQQMRIRKFVTPTRATLGIYVDLALRNGPKGSDYHSESRGSVTLAQDFRPDDAQLAFATSPGLFPLLGPDAKFRMAEETATGSGDFEYPLYSDFGDADSKRIGHVKSIKIGPEPSFSLTSGRLQVDVHAEYTDAPGDPDFHAFFTLQPQLEPDQVDPNDPAQDIGGALVEWDPDVDIDFGFLATVFMLLAGLFVAILFSPFLGWAGTILAGSLLGLLVLKEQIAEPLAAQIVEDGAGDTLSDASFLSALPLRLPGAERRWDPFYVTQHQVVSLVDQVIIDHLGIAFAAQDLALDKQPFPRADVRILEEVRAADGSFTELHYLVPDLEDIEEDIQDVGPGLDRLDWSEVDPLNEFGLISLTMAQIAARMAVSSPAQKRLHAPVTYTAERIHLVNSQIDALLCLSRVEKRAVKNPIVREKQTAVTAGVIADEGDDIRDEVTQELENDLGRTPTAEEIEEAFNTAVSIRTDEEMKIWLENDLRAILADAVAPFLRFDLAPEEMIALQDAGILALNDVEIITRENADGTIIRYYRDHPDGDKRDNLLSLPHYAPPYVPPA